MLLYFLGYKEIRLLCCAERKEEKRISQSISTERASPEKKHTEREEKENTSRGREVRRRKNYAN
jgi:hypothetical protein